jgi:hypothetical protein
MGRIVGIVFAGCAAAIWYVMAHGLDQQYQPLGADGPLLSGTKIVAAALGTLVGLVFLVTSLARFSLPGILVGAVLLYGAGSVVWNAQSEEGTVAAVVAAVDQAPPACRDVLTEDPDLALRLITHRDQAPEILAEAARARVASGPSATDRECLAEARTWTLQALPTR